MSETHRVATSGWNGVERRVAGNYPNRIAIVFSRERTGPKADGAAQLPAAAIAARDHPEAVNPSI